MEKRDNILYLAVANRDLRALKKLIREGIQFQQLAWEEIDEDAGEIYTPLEKAIELNDIEIIKVLIEAGKPFPDWIAWHIPDAIHVASFYGNFEVVQILLSLEIKGWSQEGLATNALNGAITGENMNAIEFALQSGADVNAFTNWGTPLIHAIVHANDVNIIKFLIRSGAEINVVDEERVNTPLSAAISRGDFNLVNFLVEVGADVNSYTWSRKCFYLKRPEDEKIFQYLLTQDSDVNEREWHDRYLYLYLKQKEKRYAIEPDDFDDISF